MALARFLASSPGRVTRIIAGIAIILIGYLRVDTPWKYEPEAVGLVPIATGVFDFCPISAMTDHPFRGKEIRGEG